MNSDPHKAAHPPAQPARTYTLWGRLQRVWRHRWMDDADTRRAVPPDLLKRLENYVAASEARHSGEVRICVEAGLPNSYLWRGASPRERAVAMFGKLRVWDTEHNNGVLIYLLLAENAIEILADRGLNSKVSTAQWQAITQRMSAAFKASQFEEGLTQALQEVSGLLVQHFALRDGETSANSLPNAPDVR